MEFVYSYIKVHFHFRLSVITILPIVLHLRFECLESKSPTTMQVTKLHSILLATLVLSCHLITPMVEAMHQQNNNNGLAVLLAAGLLAKLLHHHHKHEEHHIHIPVHHGHHEHHGHHHGSGSARVLSHQPAPFHHLYGGVMAASNMYPQVMYAQPAARYPPHAPY